MAERAYELRYLPIFLSDLSDTVYYLSRVLKSPSAAERLVEGIEEKLRIYRENPLAAPLYRSSSERPEPYRWFSVGSYLVFFVVLDGVVEVRRLVYGARDLTRFVP